MKLGALLGLFLSAGLAVNAEDCAWGTASETCTYARPAASRRELLQTRRLAGRRAGAAARDPLSPFTTHGCAAVHAPRCDSLALLALPMLRAPCSALWSCPCASGPFSSDSALAIASSFPALELLYVGAVARSRFPGIPFVPSTPLPRRAVLRVCSRPRPPPGRRAAVPPVPPVQPAALPAHARALGARAQTVGARAIPAGRGCTHRPGRLTRTPLARAACARAGRSLYGQGLSGPIPTELGTVSSLTYLFVAPRRRPAAPLPQHLGSRLASTRSCPPFSTSARAPLCDSRPLPPRRVTPARERRRALYGNALDGAIPTELGELAALTALYATPHPLHRVSGAAPLHYHLPLPPRLGALRSATHASLRACACGLRPAVVGTSRLTT